MNYMMNDNEPDTFAMASTSDVLAPVVAREIQGIGQNGEELPAQGFVGNYTIKDGQPQFLGVVSDSYKLVQMRDLCAAAEDQMREHFDRDVIDSIEIKDYSGRGGAYVSRSYTVKAFKEALRYGNTTAKTLQVGTTVAAKMYLRTGYDGETRTSVGTGPVDLVCNNGMVALTNVDAFSRKHTAGSDVSIFQEWIENAIPTFERYVEEMRGWAQQPVEWSQVETAIHALPGVSERRAVGLLEQIGREVRSRGLNFYAVVSGLTYYSSHDSLEFPVRNTGNDNVATTLAVREQEVARWIRSEPLLALAA